MQPVVLRALEFDRLRQPLAFGTRMLRGGPHEGGNVATIAELKD